MTESQIDRKAVKKWFALTFLSVQAGVGVVDGSQDFPFRRAKKFLCCQKLFIEIIV